MVEPKLRSRSKKKVKRRTPGGRTVIHYNKKKQATASCGRCQTYLFGKREGPYSNVLCVKCSETLIKYVTRFKVKFRYEPFKDINLRRDLTIEKFLPRGWWERVSSGLKIELTKKKAFKRAVKAKKEPKKDKTEKKEKEPKKDKTEKKEKKPVKKTVKKKSDKK